MERSRSLSTRNLTPAKEIRHVCDFIWQRAKRKTRIIGSENREEKLSLMRGCEGDSQKYSLKWAWKFSWHREGKAIFKTKGWRQANTGGKEQVIQIARAIKERGWLKPAKLESFYKGPWYHDLHLGLDSSKNGEPLFVSKKES